MSPALLKQRKTRRRALVVGLMLGAMASTAASALALADSPLDWLPRPPQAQAPARLPEQSPAATPSADTENSETASPSWLISGLD